MKFVSTDKIVISCILDEIQVILIASGISFVPIILPLLLKLEDSKVDNNRENIFK
jgi:hypothetical protein